MNRIRELIHSCRSHNLISCCLKYLQISRKTCRLTADIYHLFNPEINNLLNRFWMDSISWWVKYDKVWFIFQLIHNFQYISCDKFTVIKFI